MEFSCRLDNSLQSVWHQRTEISITSTHEDLEGLDRISHGLQPLVARLRDAGAARWAQIANLQVSKVLPVQQMWIGSICEVVKLFCCNASSAAQAYVEDQVT